MSTLFTQLKNGDTTMDSLLFHDKHISEIDISDLHVNVIPSGFPSLDDYQLLKDKRSELIIVGGRPSHGKSAFMFQIAKNVAEVSNNLAVQVFSLEMDRESIVSRQIAGELNRSLSAIQAGAIPQKDIVAAHAKLSRMPYYIDDRAGLGIDDIIESAITRHMKSNTCLIVIDYLQLIKGRGHGTRDQEVTDMTSSLKQLARELKIPIMVGAQLNRACEHRGSQTGDYKPILSDLRESGGIEQDADVVAFVHRESRYNGNRPGEADIIIAKNRNGAVGTVTMDFTQQQTRFIDRKQDGI